MKDAWTTSLSREFQNLAQGDKKTNTSGMDAIFVMDLEQIRKIPPDRVVTYAGIVVDIGRRKD